MAYPADVSQDDGAYSSSFHSFRPEPLWLPISPSAASTAVEESRESKASADAEEEQEPPVEVENPPPEKGAAKSASCEVPIPAPMPSGAATLLRAKALSRMAMDDSAKEYSGKAHPSHVQRLREECQAARNRIQMNVSSVSKVSETARSLEAHLVNLQVNKNRVKHARNARAADLAVCQQRLKILSHLDLSELDSATVERMRHLPNGRDRGLRRSLVEAMEIEQDALLLLRRELGSLLNDFDSLIEVTSELRSRLQQEASERRAAMRKDHATLKQTEQSSVDGQETPAFKAFDDGNFWVKKAKSFEDRAQQLLQKSVSTIQWTDVECAKANHKVQECLVRCSEEDQQLRRQYNAQLKDVDFAISCADWTIQKPENRSIQGSDPKFSQVQRANVLIHELIATQKHLKSLIRKCKRDLQILEACRNTTVFTIQKSKKSLSKAKLISGVEAENSRQTSSTESSVHAGLEELRHLQAEERELRKELRSCETGVERCAAWASLLADLEDRIAETLRS